MQFKAAKFVTYTFKTPNATTDIHINDSEKPHTWEEGITHTDREGNLWSAHYKGFIQYRKLIKGENYVKPK